MLFNKRLSELLFRNRKRLGFCHTQKSNYVNVKMKWKKDYSFDSIDIINKSKELRTLISLKNIIVREPNSCIPISAISKKGPELDLSFRVASFLRKYPSVFEEFTGPQYNLPWFKLTQQAIDLDCKERAVFEARRLEIVDRLRRLILMSREKRLPLRVIQGMLWYLGLPDDFLRNPEENSNSYFRFVEMGDGDQGLCTVDRGEMVLSVLQRNAAKQLGKFGERPPSTVTFPLFPSKGLRLKRKIENWLEKFQNLPYISPYEDFSDLDPNSDASEKRVAGVLHELLSLFVDNSAERRKLLCLKKYLGLPQKFDKAFERHPHVFYLLLKNKTCTVVLKEAYCAGSASAIERHPILDVRKKYLRLMNESQTILRNRRNRKPLAELAARNLDGDVDTESGEGSVRVDEDMDECL